MNRPLSVLARPAFKNALRNPYNFLLYTALLAKGVTVREYSSPAVIADRSDILHIHWPESFVETSGLINAAFSFAKHMALIELCRIRGTKIVWTIHDLQPHDYVYKRMESGFWRSFMQRIDAVIALTSAGLDLAQRKLEKVGRIPTFVIPHGHYRGYYPNVIFRSEARRRLAVPESVSVVTYLGHIRPYKNVPHLIDVFCRTTRRDTMLFICGRLSKRIDLEPEIRTAAGGDPRVRLCLGHVPDEDIQLYCNAADLMVFPYNSILNSGSAMLALSFNKPILVPHMGSLPELQQVVGPAWVMTYRGELTTQILDEALVWARTAEREPAPRLSAFEWENIADDTIDAFRYVLDGAAPPRHRLGGRD